MQSMFGASIKLIMYTLTYAGEGFKKITAKENDELILMMHYLSGRLVGMSWNPGSLSSQKRRQE